MDIKDAEDKPIEFSPNSVEILRLAESTARGMFHNYLGTEHILLAISDLTMITNSMRNLLQFYGVSWVDIKDSITRQISLGPSPTLPGGNIARTPRVNDALLHATNVARQGGYSSVFPEHLLYGLAEEIVGVAGIVLRQHNLTGPKIREYVDNNNLELWTSQVMKQYPTKESSAVSKDLPIYTRLSETKFSYLPADAYLKVVYDLIEMKVNPDLAARLALDVFRLVLNQPRIEEPD